MSLDIETIMVGYVVTMAVCVGIVLLLWLQNRHRVAGAGWWLASFVVQWAAVALMALRGRVPDGISIVGSDMLSIGGVLLLYEGIARFVGKRGVRLYQFLLLAAFTAIHVYVTFIRPDGVAHTLNFSIGLLVFCAQCVWLLLRSTMPAMYPTTRRLSFVLVGYSVVSVARIVLVLIAPPANNPFAESGTLDTLSVLAYQALSVLLASSLLLMVNRRLLNEMAQEVAERQQRESEIARLASFPRLNANPVLEVAMTGAVTYCNPAGQRILEQIGRPGETHAFLPPDIPEVLRALAQGESTELKREVRLNGTVWNEYFYLVPEFQTVRLYAVDITARKQVEEHLARSLERLHLATRAAHLGIWDWDIPKNELMWDDGMYALYGVRREDFAGAYEAWLSGLHPDDRAAGDALSQQARRGEREYDTEFRIVWPDGAIRTLKAYGQVFWDAAGNAIRMVGVNYDITEHKRAEAAVLDREASFKALVENTDSSIWSVDTQYCLIVGNAVFHRDIRAAFGREFAAGESVLSAAMSAEARAEWQSYYDRALQGERFGLELRRRFVSRISWVEYRFSPIVAAAGQVLGVTILGRDITAQKQTEAALHEKTEELDKFFSNALDLLCISDTDGYFRRLNAEWETTLGYSLEELQGRRFLDFVHSDDLERTLGAISRLGAQEEVLNFVNRYRCRDGSYRWIEWRSFPAGALIYSAARDITKRKQTEEALRASEERWRLSIENMLEAYALHEAIFDENGRMVDYRFLEFNPAAQKMSNITREAIVGRTALELYPHVVERGLMDRYADVVATGVPAYIEDFYYAGDRLDKAFDISCFRIDPRHFVCVFRDVTERKQAEEALRRFTQRLQIQHEIDAAILAAQSPEEIAAATLTRLRTLIPYQIASIAEISFDQQWGRDIMILNKDQVVAGTSAWHPLNQIGDLFSTLKRGETYFVADFTAVEALSGLEQSLLARGLRSYISIPLLAQTVPIGALSLAAETPDFFQPSHLEILHELAASLAVALQQTRLWEQTRADAQTKAMLLREVNHRVLNNLAMIQALLDIEQQQPITDAADFEAALSDLSHRIAGLSAVHRLLSRVEWAPLDLAGLITEVIHAALSGAPFRDTIQVAVTAPDVPLSIPSKQAVALALICNELTTNSVKYAFTGRAGGQLQVQIAVPTGDASAVQIVFRDDGAGWPEDVLSGERRSVGLWLVETNVRHTLGGDLALCNAAGAVAAFTFPLAPAPAEEAEVP